MPTTTYTSPTYSVNAIGARTDAAGAAVNDFTAEEARFPLSTYTEGYLTPATSWKVEAQAVPNMTVKVGSGVAKADKYVVVGEVAGQENYVVRLDVASQNVTIDAADASQTRTDEIYLVVRDHVYDASSRALAQIGYRKGDLGGANPGVDAAWRASVILARITVAAAATTITNANITDLRTTSDPGFISRFLADAKGDLFVATAADTVTRLAVGTTAGHVLTVNSATSSGMEWAVAGATPISSVLLASPAASIDFTGIPQTHKHLQLIIHALTTGSFAQINCRVNGVTSGGGGLYESQILEAYNLTVTCARITGSDGFEVGIVGDDDPSTNEAIIADYTNSTIRKLCVARSSFDLGGWPKIWTAAGRLFNNSAAITRLTLIPASGNFNTGTRVSLYGLS